MAEPVHVHPPTTHQDPLRVALDYLEEGFQIIGPDWRYVYVNPAAARHGRREASELIGKPLIEAYPGIEGTPLFDILQECMEQRTARVLENHFGFLMAPCSGSSCASGRCLPASASIPATSNTASAR
jgi:PAS domain-containing protein